MVASCEDQCVSSTMHVNSSMASENPLVKKSENRRNNKPIMEKRRRARINNCLNELKGLILETTKRDPSRHTKLEKADILEMTVRYLRSNKKKQLVSSDPSGANHFRSGFGFCANAISKFPGLDLNLKRKLLHYLSNCWNQHTLQSDNHHSTLEDNKKDQILLTSVALLLPTNTSSFSNVPNQSTPIFLPIPQRTSSTHSASSASSRADTPESLEQLREDHMKPLSLVVKRRTDEEVPNVWRPF